MTAAHLVLEYTLVDDYLERRAGLAEEGVAVDLATLRRAHALQLLLFTGLSSIPFELLDEQPTDALRAMAATRAAIARHSLDLLDQTS